MKKIELYHTGLKLGLNNTQVEKIIIGTTGLSKSQLFLYDRIDDDFVKKIILSFQDFQSGIPLEYILKEVDFYGLIFYVDNRVLIPRNDTEIMVDQVLNEISSELDKEVKESEISLIDVGTGSGCIPIAIIKNSQHINKAYVIDLQEKALEICKKNINTHCLENKISMIQGDLLHEFIGDKEDMNFSRNTIITANLPYIKKNDFLHMDQSVINHEPDSALYGGAHTGFELYEKLLEQCKQLKKIYKFKTLTLFIEIGFDQYEYSKKYLENIGLLSKYYKDNCGIWRCIKIKI